MNIFEPTAAAWRADLDQSNGAEDAFDRLCVDISGALRRKLSEAHGVLLKELQNERDHYASEAAHLAKECARLAAMVVEPSQDPLCQDSQSPQMIQRFLHRNPRAADPGSPSKLFSNRPEPTRQPPCLGTAEDKVPASDQEEGGANARSSPTSLRAAGAQMCASLPENDVTGRADMTEERAVQPYTIGNSVCVVLKDTVAMNRPLNNPSTLEPRSIQARKLSPVTTVSFNVSERAGRINTNDTARSLTNLSFAEGCDAVEQSVQAASPTKSAIRRMFSASTSFRTLRSASSRHARHSSIVQSQDVALKEKAVEAGIRGISDTDFHDGEYFETGKVDGILAKCRRHVHRIVVSRCFEIFFCIAILTNSVLLGVEVNHAVANPGNQQLLILFIVCHGHTLIFCIELFLRFLAYESGVFFCGSQWAWNWLDIIIVFASVVELVTDSIHLNHSDRGNVSKGVSNARIVRIARILKLIRILRITRLLKFAHSLRLLVLQIVGAFESVFWALILMLLINYVFSMIFVQTVSDFLSGRDDDEYVFLLRYWGTLPRTMYTLYKAVTGGVDWEIVVNPLADVHWVAVVIFMLFVFLVLFAVMNVLTGVFCQRAIEAAARDRETLVRAEIGEKRLFAKKAKELFNHLGSDEKITYQQFEAHMQDEQVVAYFSILGLDHHDAWDLFKLMDADRSAVIDIDEFVSGFMRLRGSAKSIDLAKLAYENKQMRCRLATFMAYVEDTLPLIMDETFSTRQPSKARVTVP